MIYDRLENLKQQKGVLAELAELLATLSPDTPEGKIDLYPGKLYVSVANSTPRDAAGGFFEQHRDFADLQMVLDGEELCLMNLSDNLKSCGEYRSDGDYQLSESSSPGHTVSLYLTPGLFALIYPGEKHMPSVAGNIALPHKKLVAKIHRDLL